VRGVVVYEEEAGGAKYLLAYKPFEEERHRDTVQVLRMCKIADDVEDCYWLEYRLGDLRVVRLVDRSGQVEVKVDFTLDALTAYNGDPWFVLAKQLESALKEFGVYRTIALIVASIAERLCENLRPL
jgi:hypothetical protein